MGKALLIIVIGFSTLFATSTLNMSRHTLESIKNYSTHYEYANARNAATSGVYMSLSKLYQAIMSNSTWTAGFQNLTLNNANLNVDIQSVSPMALRIVSTGTYGNISKNVNVLVGVPPDLADLAIFVTKTITDVTPLDSTRTQDNTLAIQNAPEMLPFDKESLVALAVSQSTPGCDRVIDGNFTAPDDWPTNDITNDFYWDLPNKEPNVTHVKGDLTLDGNTNVYGIFVVEGNVTFNGAVRMEGVLYLPNPGSIVINGGGSPSESSITGGVFANGSMDGKGNHISVEYKREFMVIFADYQLAQNLFIISWVETPDSSSFNLGTQY